MGGSGSFVCGDFVSESLCRVCRGNRDQEVGFSIALWVSWLVHHFGLWLQPLSAKIVQTKGMAKKKLAFLFDIPECRLFFLPQAKSANEGKGKEILCISLFPIVCILSQARTAKVCPLQGAALVAVRVLRSDKSVYCTFYISWMRTATRAAPCSGYLRTAPKPFLAVPSNKRWTHWKYPIRLTACIMAKKVYVPTCFLGFPLGLNQY